MAVSRKKSGEDKPLNETGRRASHDRRTANRPVAKERREVQRRRQIDPTTCERDYTDDEIDFMQALDEYKRASGRMFPTCSEILEVIRALGYRRIAEPVSAAEFNRQANDDPSAAAAGSASEADNSLV